MGDEFIIVGGYESGVDAAYHLLVKISACGFLIRVARGKQKARAKRWVVAVLLERMRTYEFLDKVEVHPNTSIASIVRSEKGFEVITENGESLETKVPPLLAHGFEGSHKLVADLFEPREDGFPLLNEHDESTISPGMFLCGPAVRHNNFIFCFIYKHRQRFAVVAKTIATLWGCQQALRVYRSFGMYLDDLSCCGEACVC